MSSEGTRRLGPRRVSPEAQAATRRAVAGTLAVVVVAEHGLIRMAQAPDVMDTACTLAFAAAAAVLARAVDGVFPAAWAAGAVAWWIAVQPLAEAGGLGAAALAAAAVAWSVCPNRVMPAWLACVTVWTLLGSPGGSIAGTVVGLAVAIPLRRAAEGDPVVPWAPALAVVLAGVSARAVDGAPWGATLAWACAVVGAGAVAARWPAAALVAAGGVWIDAAGPLRPARVADPADVVIVTVDALRADAASQLDVFTRETPGAVDYTAWTPAPWTFPALRALATGQPPAPVDLPIVPASLPAPAGPTLARALGAAGWTTLARVDQNPFAARALDDGAWDRFGAPRWTEPGTLPRGLSNASRGRPFAARVVRPAVLREGAAETVEAALAEVARVRGPALLWVHLMDLHLPWPDAPCRAEVLGRTDARRVLAEDPWWSTPDGLACLRAGYEARLARIDVALRALVDGVGRPGLLVLTADHGEALGDAGFEHGHSSAPPVGRIPLRVVASPPWQPTSTPVDLVDVGTTIAAWAGVGPVGVGRDLRGPIAPRPIRIGPPLYGDAWGEVDVDGVWAELP